ICSAKETPLSDVNEEQNWQQLFSRIESSKVLSTFSPKRRKRPVWSSPSLQWGLCIAAIFLVVVIGSFVGTKGFSRLPWQSDTRPDKLITKLKTIKVEKGQRVTATLPDGSFIHLDSGSELTYPETFADARKVYLKGEAYFEVKHNPQKPFLVYAHHALVQVLGTKFNIRAWDKASDVIVLVKEGTVSLEATTLLEPEKVILGKNNLSTLAPKGSPTSPVLADVEKHLAWLHYEMNFRDAPVKEILAQLSRWYNLEFITDDPDILDIRLSVHLKKTNMDHVLEVIAILTNTQINKKGHVIELVPQSFK
ncbi:DUF4974 domain-containing protein, partial [candidate division KSB1 bacterium]|nr:DUF4974 domain-containing protein [candidate division KSB1 bacterium]